MFILIFLISIILANLSVAFFGAVSIPINAFLLIGLDLTLRDKLHEQWHGENLKFKMFGLIVASGLITYLFNKDAANICIASVIAFSGALAIDTIIYELLFKYKKLVKINSSNIGSAAVDSVLFPTIAFGILMPDIIILQFFAKILGGFLWSLLLTKFDINTMHN